MELPLDFGAFTMALERFDYNDPSGRELRAVITNPHATCVPSGADAYVLYRLVERSDDDSAVTLLGACRRSMTPLGRIVLFEAVTRLRGEMVAFGSPWTRQRLLGDYGRLLSRAGFGLSDVTPLTYGFSLIEGYPYG